MSPVSTPFPERAIPSTYSTQTPKKYKVLKTIPNIEEGKIIPWFNQPGMGVQYKLEKSVQYYIAVASIKYKNSVYLPNHPP